jgi:hypothetical protein
MELDEPSTKKQKTSEKTNSDAVYDEFEEEEFYVVVELPDYENMSILQTSKAYNMIVNFIFKSS